MKDSSVGPQARQAQCKGERLLLKESITVRHVLTECLVRLCIKPVNFQQSRDKATKHKYKLMLCFSMHVSLVFKLCLHQTRASNDLKETVDLSKKSHFVQGLRHNRVAFEFKLRSGIRCESNRAAVCEQNTMNETSVCTNIALSFALALGLFLQPYMCWPAGKIKGAKTFRKSFSYQRIYARRTG